MLSGKQIGVRQKIDEEWYRNQMSRFTHLFCSLTLATTAVRTTGADASRTALTARQLTEPIAELAPATAACPTSTTLV